MLYVNPKLNILVRYTLLSQNILYVLYMQCIYQALRICAGACKTSLIESMIVISGEKPLNNYRNQLSINFILKSRSFPHNSSHQILTNYGLQVQNFCRPRSSILLHIRMDGIMVESKLEEIKTHNVQHHRNIPWTMTIKQHVISTMKNSSYLPAILTVSLGNI